MRSRKKPSVTGKNFFSGRAFHPIGDEELRQEIPGRGEKGNQSEQEGVVGEVADIEG
jgi:hypothetical protein